MLSIINVNDDHINDNTVRQAADCLNDGGLVVFPTETVYGIAALATSSKAMNRLREIKSRPTNPFSVHVASSEDVPVYVRDIPLRGRFLMRKSWPGPVTLLMDTGGRFGDDKLMKVPGLYQTLTMDGVIGLRCVDQPFSTRMLAAVDGPVVAPSANLAGGSSPRSADEVPREIIELVDLVVDAGPTKYGTDSSIVRVNDESLAVLRQGVIDARMIDKMARWKIGFVCTGNTCRSPMAEAIAKKLASEYLGCEPDKLEKFGLELYSAGTSAANGQPASAEAVAAMSDAGCDISCHRSKMCNADLILASDQVLCMCQWHVAQLMRQYDLADICVTRLDGDCDIDDPVGCGGDVYAAVAAQISDALDSWIKEVTGR